MKRWRASAATEASTPRGPPALPPSAERPGRQHVAAWRRHATVVVLARALQAAWPAWARLSAPALGPGCPLPGAIDPVWCDHLRPAGAVEDGASCAARRAARQALSAKAAACRDRFRDYGRPS